MQNKTDKKTSEFGRFSQSVTDNVLTYPKSVCFRKIMTKKSISRFVNIRVQFKCWEIKDRKQSKALSLSIKWELKQPFTYVFYKIQNRKASSLLKRALLYVLLCEFCKFFKSFLWSTSGRVLLTGIIEKNEWLGNGGSKSHLFFVAKVDESERCKILFATESKSIILHSLLLVVHGTSK